VRFVLTCGSSARRGGAFAHRAGESPAAGSEDAPDDGGQNRKQRRKAAERHLGMGTDQPVGDEQRGAVESAAEKSAIRTSPAIAMLEPGHEGSDGGKRAEGVVGAARHAEQDTGHDPDQGRQNAPEYHLNRTRAINEQHRREHRPTSSIDCQIAQD